MSDLIQHRQHVELRHVFTRLKATFISFVAKSTGEMCMHNYERAVENKHLHVNNTNTHTHLFNGPLSGTTRVGRYQKGKTNLDFTEARDSEWQWQPLGHMQVCTSLQADNHASTPPLSFFTGRMPFLPPNQQCQSTEGTCT